MPDNYNEIFKIILDSVDLSVFVADPNSYKILYANKAFQAKFKDSLIGKKCHEVLQNQGSPCSYCSNKKLFREPPISPCIWEKFDEKRGKWYQFRDYCMDWRDEYKVHLGISIDITELRDSKERFEHLVELLPETILESDENFQITYVNQKACKEFGFSREELEQKINIKMLFAPEELPKLESNIEKILKGEELEPHEYVFQRKDGTQFWGLIHNKIIYKGGKFAGLRGLIRNITELKKIHEALSQSEQLLEDILTASSVGISHVVDRKIQWANEAMRELFRYIKEEEYMGKDTGILYANEREYERIGKIVYNQLSSQGKGEFDAKFKRADGNFFNGHVKINYLKKNDPSKGIIVSIMDISKRVKIEQNLTESERRYKEAFNKADFYKDLLAHDMSNILNNISASIQLFELGKDDPEIFQDIDQMEEIIKKQIERGTSLISNVRKLSSLEGKEMILKPINALHVLNTAINEIYAQYDEVMIKVYKDKLSSEPIINAGELLIDAFRNILNNGIKYNTNKQKRIDLILSEIEIEDISFLKIRFKDNGIGIEEERKDTIFDRRFTEDKSTGGMGIGLSLVKMILNGYGGKVSVENRIKGDHSKGSNFIVFLKRY